MAILHATISHRSSKPYVYGVIGNKRLMSFDNGIATIYKDHQNSTNEDIVNHLRAISPNKIKFAEEGDSDRYGDIHARVMMTSYRFIRLCKDLNHGQVGIKHSGEGLLSVHDSKDSIEEDDVIIGNYTYTYGADGFELWDNKQDAMIIRGSVAMDKVLVNVGAYEKWGEAKYNNRAVTNNEGILESAHHDIAEAIRMIKDSSTSMEIIAVRMKQHLIYEIAEYLVGALAIPNASYEHMHYESFERYFTIRKV